MSSRELLTAALVGGVLVASAPGASGPFVYPQKGQSQAQQDQDRAACDGWARQQTGIDPNAPPPSGRRGGKMVGGAAKGAAAGAAVGAIAGDAGKGAGAGAVVGGLAGRRRGKQEQQAAASEQQSTYARAFSACMEGRGYTVR
jgi:hypothetical protein